MLNTGKCLVRFTQEAELKKKSHLETDKHGTLRGRPDSINSFGHRIHLYCPMAGHVPLLRMTRVFSPPRWPGTD